MSSFCGGNASIPAFTSRELLDDYPSGIIASIDTPPATHNGIADDAWIQQTVQKLEASGILPKPTNLSKINSTPFDSPDTRDPLAKYVNKDRTLQDNIKKEYCFYETRYFAALDNFLQSIADSSLKGKPADVNSKLDTCKQLNSKLNLLTQIVNGISKYRHSNNSKYQSSINSINDNLRTRQKSLQEQSDILNKETASAELYKRMVGYTIEKNNANQNLLTLYGVLNLVALGIIVYISRN